MFQTEEKLIHLASQGDVKAYEKLISKYEQKIYGICLRLLKEPEEAYDAAQEVCLKIWHQIGTFKGEAKFSTWVYRLTTNQCLDLLRKQKRRGIEVPLTLEAHQKEPLGYRQDVWEDMSSHLEQKELTAVLQQALLELKENYRIMIVLRDIEGYAYEEIAQILDLSLGTVKSRLSRARQALKKILEQDREPYRSFFRHNKNKGV